VGEWIKVKIVLEPAKDGRLCKLVDKLEERTRKRKMGNKEYRWKNFYLRVIIPKDYADRKFLVVPLTEEEYHKLKEAAEGLF